MKRHSKPLAVCVVFVCAEVCGAEVTLVRDGEPAATIVVARLASAQVQAAADTLAQYVFEASGARLQVVRDDAVPEDQAGSLIHVGATRGP